MSSPRGCRWRTSTSPPSSSTRSSSSRRSPSSPGSAPSRSCSALSSSSSTAASSSSPSASSTPSATAGCRRPTSPPTSPSTPSSASRTPARSSGRARVELPFELAEMLDPPPKPAADAAAMPERGQGHHHSEWWDSGQAIEVPAGQGPPVGVPPAVSAAGACRLRRRLCGAEARRVGAWRRLSSGNVERGARFAHPPHPHPRPHALFTADRLLTRGPRPGSHPVFPPQ